MSEKELPKYDVVIVGAGVVGSALFYTLSKYTSIKRIALIEKYERPAQVNSHHSMNSQTLHFGDIETNYSLEKAKKVKRMAEMVASFVEQEGEPSLFKKSHKMVLGVGKDEKETLRQRYETFKDTFPHLRFIGKDEIEKHEPKILQKRDSNVELSALYSPNGYIVNYYRLSQCFVDKACAVNNKTIHTFFNERVESIERSGSSYTLKTDKRTFNATVVVVSTGAHSLCMAKSLGIGKQYGILPVAGNWYCAWHILNGKVYTLQTPKLPFAAVHGDPSVTDLDQTRFGPTAKVIPVLERQDISTFYDFLKTSVYTLKGILSLFNILRDRVIFLFVLKNLSYDIPFLGKYFYLKEVRKIAPSVRYTDLSFLRGGVRPQLVDTNKMALDMGEAKLIGENIIFNITPSPGASVCLGVAYEDTEQIIKFFGEKESFNKDQFNSDLRLG